MVIKMAEEMMNKHNVDVLGDYMAEDINDHNPPTGSKPGLEGIKEAMKMFLGAFPDLKIQVDDLIAEGDLVVLLGADEGDDGRLSARIRAFGRFALMKDNMPPTISGLHPETGSVVDADITFSAGVTDTGAGIGREEDVVIELDGVRLVSEYDPEAERVTASPDQSLEAGAHHLVLTLRDAAGNETVASTDFISR